MNQKIPTPIGTVIIIILAFAAGYFVWLVQRDNLNNTAVDIIDLPSQKACTEEAKICPDGSAVGRTGPDCEFAPCPKEVIKSVCKNLCGDGICQERVCMAIGCPCAETVESCPQDCAKNPDENIVGGDSDEYGCLGSAGYSWCEIKKKCLRTWEEKCQE